MAITIIFNSFKAMDGNPIPISEGNSTALNIYYLSERAVTIPFGTTINEDTLQQVSRFNELVTQNSFPGFCTSVPAYTTLSIFFDPMQVFHSGLPGRDCFAKVSGYLKRLKEVPVMEKTDTHDTFTIPVCYGGEFGPDLQEVAELHDLTAQQVINLHTEAVYKVYMIGFVPGFAYLGGLNHMLETPRKTTPRSNVAAGSVGIAGKQTGIYPLATPGGWQLIGRTPLTLFDAGRQQPSLLKAGDSVVFKPVSMDEFNALNHK